MGELMKLVVQAFEDAALAENLHLEAAFRAELRRDAAAALKVFEREADRLPVRVVEPARAVRANITWEQEPISL